jgi:hypothetical protein
METDCLQRNNTFKFKITLDRHNARLKLIYCFLRDPLHFSLPSSFNVLHEKDKTDPYHIDADPDPASQNDADPCQIADPDPQHCHLLFGESTIPIPKNN